MPVRYLMLCVMCLCPLLCLRPYFVRGSDLCPALHVAFFVYSLCLHFRSTSRSIVSARLSLQLCACSPMGPPYLALGLNAMCAPPENTKGAHSRFPHRVLDSLWIGCNIVMTWWSPHDAMNTLVLFSIASTIQRLLTMSRVTTVGAIRLIIVLI